MLSCKSCFRASCDPSGVQSCRLTVSERPLKEKRILYFEISILVFSDKMRKKKSYQIRQVFSEDFISALSCFWVTYCSNYAGSKPGFHEIQDMAGGKRCQDYLRSSVLTLGSEHSRNSLIHSIIHSAG